MNRQYLHYVEMKMKYKQLKRKLRDNIAQKKANRDMADHYKDLLDTSISELKFKNMKADYLSSVLTEIKSFTEDKLVVSVIKNALERDFLDTLIHSRKLINK